MERGLRDLIASHPTEEFRGIYVEGGLKPTRKNVLAPGAVGIYSAGSIYNPAQVLRDATVKGSTEAIDKKLAGFKDKEFQEMSIEDMQSLIALTKADPNESELVWNSVAVAESLAQFAKLHKQTSGYVFVARDRDLKEKRRETQGILSGGETAMVPDDKIALFLLRTKASGGNNAAWWPQIRFPDGRYAFAFAV